MFCALFGKLCANAPTVADALALLAPAQGRAAPGRRSSARAASARTSPALPHEPGVYVFRDADGRALYVGKSIDLRTRARAHFTSGATLGGARPSTSTTS